LGAIHWLAGQSGSVALERPGPVALSHQRDHVANGRGVDIEHRPAHLLVTVVGDYCVDVLRKL